MSKVLVAGASGSVGKEVIKKLKKQNIPFRALDKAGDAAKDLINYTDDIVLTDASDPRNLERIFDDIDVTFSAVGQSVSLFTKGGSFEDTDYKVNKNLIDASLKAGVKRFVYISLKGADAASGLVIADVHKRIEDLLNTNDIDHTVIRPVGFFSGFHDWLILGKKGAIPVPGSGVHKTNPIHQEDLAQVVFDNLFSGPQVLEVGGPEIFTRNEIAQMVYEKTGGEVLHIPQMVIKPSLFFLRYIDDNVQAKLDYFKFVSTNDMIAKKYGNHSLREYIKNFDLNRLPDAW